MGNSFANRTDFKKKKTVHGFKSLKFFSVASFYQFNRLLYRDFRKKNFFERYNILI